MVQFPNQSRGEFTCPLCESSGLHAFYRVDQVPTTSNLLISSQSDALNWRGAPLELCHCRRCGFVCNPGFVPAAQHTAAYEATQSHSPTFTAFSKSLCRTWIDRYNLTGKVLLEIGCLQGEFIEQLCEISGCSGIGIDPEVDAAKVGTRGNVRFIKDFYGPKFRDLPADFICCRHTLEHIPDVRRFVRDVRVAIADRTHVSVCFEVPDVLRVLQEGAFWDIYYEHCSYFSPGSLARLFRDCGFEVLDLRREFDGQYLVIDAKPAASPTLARLDLEDDLAATEHAVGAFEAAASLQLARWPRVVAQSGKVVLWGSGSKAVGFLSTLGLSVDQVRAVVDINPAKHGSFLPHTGQPVIAPESLSALKPDAVIAMNPAYRAEIAKDLDALGVRATLMTL